MSPDRAASVKARLLAQAKATGEEFERTLSRFAAERFLYRLGASRARTRCVLKGATLLAVWLPSPYRATRDVDLLASGPADETSIRSLIEEVCAVAGAEDALRFDLSGLTVETIRAEEEYSGKRALFWAHLGSARIRVQVDVGFGDALAVAPEEIEVPPILKALPAPRLRAYPREASVAEKFEAMVRLGTRNSRMKDFHDVWALAGAFAFDGPSLRSAVAVCFERRGTPRAGGLPPALVPAFYQRSESQVRWSGYVAGGALLVAPPARFAVVGERITQFLGPVWSSVVSSQRFEAVWPPGGPWVPP